ncbi:MAG: amidohydrolase family protein [Myxococcales bacterium]|nr:amidohydrolase family protein [Myxococcales bacterium]
MTYAQGRLFYDSDSHIMETLDWLESGATAEEAKLLGTFANAQNAGAGVLSKVIADAEARRSDPEATAKLLEKPIISGPKGWGAYGASTPDERSKALDMLGFAAQLVFPTFALQQFARSSDPDVVYAGARALTRAMGQFCAGDTRLMGVGYLPLLDAERSLETIEIGVKAGVKAFWVSSEPPAKKSPAHVDLYPVWEKLIGHGLPIMLHIGGGKMAPREMRNNGHPPTTDWLGGGENLRGRDYVALSHSIENFLTALTLDGVFQRYPELRCGVIELGGTWVPGFLRILDQAARSFRKTEPLIGALEMKPSDYIRRHVKVSLFPHEDAGWLIEQAGEDLFMFASDYPHPEGSKDPVGRFDKFLADGGVSADGKDAFYSGNFADLMGL